MDKIGFLVAEQVDEHLVLHLRERDPDGGPAQIVVRTWILKTKRVCRGLNDLTSILFSWIIVKSILARPNLSFYDREGPFSETLCLLANNLAPNLASANFP